MPPLSECNLDFGDSIINITALVHKISKRDVFIWPDDDDKEPEKTRIAIWCTGNTRPSIDVKADNETQGLIKSMSKVCDEGMKGRLDASPSESDIIECARFALMEDGKFSVKHIGSESTITGASLVVGGSKALVTVNEDGKNKCRFQLMKKICEMGLKKRTSPNSTQVEQDVEDE
ncbi:hypothetical protein B0J15DRAFT_505447 [Fusarium solani]|uniref:Uncharacterized protein n=1 Tax=Fusarium solani TaxID=169388 RepID=A0A9P9G3N1_FUSSL|nr:uncharacterized protein B0J15DRAFT_505447 [Fusarium solani]KAH7232525.1 hypothetical protein B0J15DRAFT_505447 [Fusarium solani]